MITDQEQTRLLRLTRVEEKRAIKDLNQTGKRMTWVRAKLELSQRQVCLDNEFPPSSFCGWECGVRPELHETFWAVSRYYNTLWIEKFNDNYPVFDGEEIKKITPMWLMFGFDEESTNAEAKIQELISAMRDAEDAYFNKEAALLNQLEMFAKGGI